MPSRRSFLVRLGSVGLAATAGCLGYPESVFSAGTDADAGWPSARFDAGNSAYNPEAVAPREDVEVTWSAGDGLRYTGPAVVEGTVFQPTGDALVAIDAATGEEQWHVQQENHPTGTPTVRDGVVYAGAGNTLYALDAGTGEERWRIEDAIDRASPIIPLERFVDDPPLVVGNEDGVVRGLDPETGEERWRVDVFGSVRALAWWEYGPFVGTGGGEVYAFDGSSDGAPGGVWRTKVDGPVESLTATNDPLYVQTLDGSLTALDPGRAGVQIHTVDAKHANTAAVHASNWLYSGGVDTLSSIREWDGNVHWRVNGRYDYASPIAAGDRLYVASEEAVHAFDLAGGLGGGTMSFDVKRWSHDLPGAVAGMAVADGALFVSVSQGEDGGKALYRLDEA